jgi:hypothetical protein
MALALAIAGAVATALGGATAANGVARSCGWQAQLSGDQINVVDPDQHANYWIAALPIPPGGSVEMHGRYPHSRYFSFVTYSARTQGIDVLHDTDVVPDAGSSNPFIAGADRALGGSYTVHVVDALKPAGGRAPNTLYNQGTEQTNPNAVMTYLMMRVYVADRGLDISGGVGLPDLTLINPDGSRQSLPACPDPVPNLGITETEAAAGTRDGPPRTGALAHDPPRWRKATNVVSFVGVQQTTDNQLTGDTVYPALIPTTDKYGPSGGGYQNPDNSYLATFVSREHGQVVVMRGLAPTTPHTYAGGGRMGTGQLRYWSLCTGQPYTTQYLGCVFDEQVPLDRNGRYTIVMSTASGRPANAATQCGVAWVPLGPQPQTKVIYRNMLPAPGFRYSVQAARPDHEAADMGPYFPSLEYVATTENFERNFGCPAR